MALSKLIVEDAQSALRDLYGLIAPADRHLADADHRTVELALSTLGNLVDGMRQVEGVAARAAAELVRVKQQSDQFQEGR
jgi:hypothetical protein